MKWLLAYDGSEGSNNALAHLLKLIKDGDDVIVVTCWDAADTVYPVFPSEALATPITYIDFSAENARRKATATTIGTECGQKIRSVNQHVTVELWVHCGDARDGICDAVKKWDVETIVCGSRGHGVIKRMLVGSVSTHLVQHAGIPVMVVH